MKWYSIYSLFNRAKAVKAYKAYKKNKYSMTDADVLYPITNSPGKFVFYCPGCLGTHTINIDPDRKWPCHILTGTLDRPTIRASVLVIDRAISKSHYCHSFITDGLIQFLPDCSHSLSGQTVGLKPF